jgi:hypothetical protein
MMSGSENREEGEEDDRSIGYWSKESSLNLAEHAKHPRSTGFAARSNYGFGIDRPQAKRKSSSAASDSSDFVK